MYSHQDEETPAPRRGLDNYTGRSFLEQFTGYYQRWTNRNHYIGMIAADKFAQAVNKHIPQQKLSADTVSQILAGEYVPSHEQLIAITLEFKLFGDIQNDLLEQAGKIREEKKQLKENGEKNRIVPFRRTNPQGNQEPPSFVEMLEESYRAKLQGGQEDINTLLWDRAFKAWQHDGKDMSPEKFCELVQANNASHDGKGTLSNEVIYEWRSRSHTPIAETIEVMGKAFGFMPGKQDAEYSDFTHEVMLWKVAGGKQFRNPYVENSGDKPGLSAGGELDAAIEAAKLASNHGQLVRELVDASGISMVRLESMINCQQLNKWCKGANIEDVDMARRFLELVNPVATQGNPKKIELQNQQMLAMLTGRIFDVPTILEEAQNSKVENPGGQLLIMLTGRRGLVNITSDELVKSLNERGHIISKHGIQKIRSTNKSRGSKIVEPLAESLIDIVEQKSGINFKPYHKDCIDLLTNCLAPAKLLEECAAGRLAIGEMVRKSYMRKGMLQAEFEKAVGMSNLSEFLLGQKHLQHESARKIADWFGFADEERRKFVVMATGHREALDPVTILEKVKSGEMNRIEGLRLIYDASGMTRHELADASGANVLDSVVQRAGGRVAASGQTAQKLAKLCGLSGYENDFMQQFSAEWVSRSAGRTSSAEGQSSQKS